MADFMHFLVFLANHAEIIDGKISVLGLICCFRCFGPDKGSPFGSPVNSKSCFQFFDPSKLICFADISKA